MICDEDYSTAYVCKFDFDEFVLSKNNLIERNIKYIYSNSMEDKNNKILAKQPVYYYELPMVFNSSTIEIRRLK